MGFWTPPSIGSSSPLNPFAINCLYKIYFHLNYLHYFLFFLTVLTDAASNKWIIKKTHHTVMEVVTVYPEEALALHKVYTLTGAARSLVCSRDALGGG